MQEPDLEPDFQGAVRGHHGRLQDLRVQPGPAPDLPVGDLQLARDKLLHPHRPEREVDLLQEAARFRQRDIWKVALLRRARSTPSGYHGGAASEGDVDPPAPAGRRPRALLFRQHLQLQAHALGEPPHRRPRDPAAQVLLHVPWAGQEVLPVLLRVDPHVDRPEGAPVVGSRTLR